MDLSSLFDYGLEKDMVLMKQIADYNKADFKKHSKTIQQVDLSEAIGFLHGHVNRLPSPGGSLTCHDRILICNLREIMEGMLTVFNKKTSQIFSNYEYLVKIKEIHKEQSIIPRPLSISGKDRKKIIKVSKKQRIVDESSKVSLKDDDVLLKEPKDKSFYIQEIDFEGTRKYLDEMLEMAHKNSSAQLDRIRETPQNNDVPKISRPQIRQSNIPNVQTVQDITVGDISKLIQDRQKTISYNLSDLVDTKVDKSRSKDVEVYKNVYRVNTKFGYESKCLLTKPAKLMDPVLVYSDLNEEDMIMRFSTDETTIDFNFLTDNDELTDIIPHSHPRTIGFGEESSHIQAENAYLMESTVGDLTVREKENLTRATPAISPYLVTPNIVEPNIEETHSQMAEGGILQERLNVLLTHENDSATFSEICPPDRTSKLIAAKTFKHLMDLWSKNEIYLHQDGSEPHKIFITFNKDMSSIMQ